MLNLRVEDDCVNVPFIERNGYYCVDELNYNFKINALKAATRLNKPVKWIFNTEAYRKLDWRVSPNVDLNTLYRLRAQQLRDQYDYLVLAFSGGSDSYGVLDSFIKNNIHLDEIVCEWPESQTENLKTSMDSRAENFYSEWELTIKPALKYVQQYFPKIKITVCNGLEKLSLEDFEDTCTVTQAHGYVSIKRWREVLKRIQYLSGKFNNVGLILGIDKPKIHIEKNIFCVFFEDLHCWLKSSGNNNYLRNIEYFYWSHEMPEIHLKQAHIVYQRMLENRKLISLVQTDHMRPFIKSLIYPSWNNNTFQADKGTSVIYNEQYDWFLKKELTIETMSWESSMTSQLALVDRKYINFFPNGRFAAYKPWRSQFYPLGPI